MFQLIHLNYLIRIGNYQQIKNNHMLKKYIPRVF